MQINRLLHLQFPLDSKSSTESGAAVIRDAKSHRVSSVVVKIQPDTPSAVAGDVANTFVYSAHNKPSAQASDAQDRDRMALAHQKAQDRNQGVQTTLILDKEGLLVAKAADPAIAKPPDFVTAAVLTMRQFADEAERLKKDALGAEAKVVSSAPGMLRGLHQWTAKLKMFA